MNRKLESAPQLVAADHTRIAEIMTKGAVTVPADLGLEQLVALLVERGLSRVPVVDDQDRLIGIVSKTDLVVDRYLRGDTEEIEQTGAGGPGRHVHDFGSVVRDVMTPVAFALPASTTIRDATRRMLADNIHTVPVTSEGYVVGILSSTDVMAWVAGVDLAEARAAATP